MRKLLNSLGVKPNSFYLLVCASCHSCGLVLATQRRVKCKLDAQEVCSSSTMTSAPWR